MATLLDGPRADGQRVGRVVNRDVAPMSAGGAGSATGSVLPP